MHDTILRAISVIVGVVWLIAVSCVDDPTIGYYAIGVVAVCTGYFGLLVYANRDN